MSMRKTDWISHGLTVSYSLFFVFCSFNILDTGFSTRMTRSNLRAYESGIRASLAPENLATAPESLRLGLRVESRDLPTEEMTKTKAWSKLQNTVSEYARRLEFVEAQNELWEQRAAKRSLWLTCLSLIPVAGTLVFTLLDRKNKDEQAEKEAEIRKTGTGPT